MQRKRLWIGILLVAAVLLRSPAVPAVESDPPAGTQGHTGRAGDQAIQRGGRADAREALRRRAGEV